MRWYLNTLIGNSVVSWESLDRHYENSPPFSWTFRFYRESVLVNEYSSRMAAALNQPKLREIEDYYHENSERYKVPGKVHVKFISAAPELLRKIKLQTLAGEGLDKAVSGLAGVTVKSVVFQQDLLPDALKESVKFLSVNEISRPFLYEGKDTLVQLLGRDAEKKPTFSELQGLVAKDLYEQRKKETMNNLREKLRQQSTIAINQPLWLSISKKIREENEQ
jgi:hypothetical protein